MQIAQAAEQASDFTQYGVIGAILVVVAIGAWLLFKIVGGMKEVSNSCHEHSDKREERSNKVIEANTEMGHKNLEVLGGVVNMGTNVSMTLKDVNEELTRMRLLNNRNGRTGA